MTLHVLLFGLQLSCLLPSRDSELLLAFRRWSCLGADLLPALMTWL